MPTNDGQLSRAQRRLLHAADEIAREDPQSILYQHSIFCQTALPYRDPVGVTVWDRAQGQVSLRIRAGEVLDSNGIWRPAGLPFGPKPRLILAYLNAEALRAGSPVVEVEHSLSAFVRRIGLCRDGRSIRAVKDQLTRLATAEIRLGLAPPGRPASQVQAHIVTGFELWPPTDARQRVLWPSTVRLSSEYFASLQRHAVPLDERALAALSHNAMALDAYAWLAQRLHRIDPGRPALVSWAALRGQFGQGYGRMDNFKRVFRTTLEIVLSQYQGARLELDGRGMALRHSQPPVKGRMTVVSRDKPLYRAELSTSTL